MSVLKQVKKEAQKYALHNYGNLLSVDEPVFDKNEKLWKVKLKTEYPRLIRNDQPRERYVRTLTIGDLGVIWVDEKLKIHRQMSTPRSECQNILKTRINTWEERAERIIVQTSAFELASTAIARVFLNPVSMLLSNFLEEEEIITFVELEKLRKTQRIYQWLSLLEELCLIKKVPEGYVYGNMFTEIMRQSDDTQTFLTHVFAHVIRERYPLLRDVFRLKQFESLIHLDNCYYRPALEAKTILFKTSKSLFNRYLMQYRNRSIIELPNILLDLNTANALKRSGKYYYANEYLFEQMLDKSEDAKILSTPRV